MQRLVIGGMTGTSIDALDVAAVRVRGKGLALRAEFLGGRTRALGRLAQPLRDLAEQQPASAGRIAELAREFAELHVELIRELLADLAGRPGEAAGAARPDLIAIHGQTVYHAPPLSWQFFAPAPVAAAFGCAVVCDLRASDLAAGGQGAPITPLADWVLLRGPGPRVVLNLGGFANYTVLGPDDGGPAEPQLGRIGGGDLCACNHLLDGLARVCFSVPYDADGRWAARGTARSDWVAELTHLLGGQRVPRRSLGTGDELGVWIRERALDGAGPDLLRSACAALGGVIARGIQRAAEDAGAGELERVLVAGGGWKNPVLRADLAVGLGATPVEATDAWGLAAEFREAAEIAVLGALAADGVDLTLRQVTGARAEMPPAGLWVRGHG